MAQLSELQVEFVSDEIRERGVDLDDLHEDLLDHICTSIERRMDDGEPFESAYEQTIKLFGPGGLMQVQEQTLFFLTQMNETMKKFSIGFGLASTALLLAGMLFKIQHWPGAGILLVLGNFFLVGLYLPFMMVHKLRESKKDDYLTIILGFVGLALFASGSTFKIMHWPLASILLWAGFLTLTLGFMPLFFLRRYKSSNNKSITLTTAMLVLIGAVQVGQLLNLKNSSQHQHAATVINETLEENEALESANEQLLARLQRDQQALDLEKAADELIQKLEQTKVNLISSVAEVSLEKARTAKLSSLEHTDDFSKTKSILIGTREHPQMGKFSAPYIKFQLDSFRVQLLNTYDPDTRALVEPMIDLRTDRTYRSVYGEEQDWVLYHFLHVTMSSAVMQISQLQLEIRKETNKALLYRMSQSEAPGPPSSET